jgi:hypothetical protein
VPITYQSWSNFRSEKVGHEDGNGYEQHTTDGHDAEEVTIVIGGLVEFSAEG